jgi:hypothetical protein
VGPPRRLPLAHFGGADTVPDMASDRLYRMASRRATAWSQHRLPGYWTLFQYFGCGVLLCLLAVHLISGRTAHDGPAAYGPPSVVPSVAPHDSAPANAVAPQPGVSGPAASIAPGVATVQVLNTSGSLTRIPTAVATTATTGFDGLFNSAARAKVTLAPGASYAPLSTAYPKATIGSQELVSVSGSTYTFSAVADADGAGTAYQPAPVTLVVTAAGNGWVVNPE